MTAQMQDTVVYLGSQFDLAGINGTGLFVPQTYGLLPHASCTACWRGYLCEYCVQDGALLLMDLYVNNARKRKDGSYERCSPPPIAGKAALQSREHEPGTSFSLENYFWFFYKELGLPIQFAGSMLLAQDFIRELYVHMGFHPAWKYKTVHELVFENGQLVGAADLSSRMEEVRQNLTDEDIRPDDRAAKQELHAWVHSTFDRYYDVDDLLRRKERERLHEELASRPAMKITRIRNGFAQCPHCGVRFALYSDQSWDGEKHLSCGTRLVLPDEYAGEYGGAKKPGG